jgi:hypothetical protein
MSEVPLPEWEPGTPPTTKLRDFIHTMITRMVSEDSPAWQSDLMLRELTRPTAACAELVRDYIRPMADILTGILDELLPPAVPHAKRYMIAFSIVGQCFYYKVNKPIITLLIGEEEYRRLTTARLAEHIAEFSLAALGYVPPLKGGKYEPAAARTGQERDHVPHADT